MTLKVTEKAISRALGEELRRARDALGLSRAQFVATLPSGIGERTLLAYEHGLRNITVARLEELCKHLEVDAPNLLTRALQRAKIHLENLELLVDLRQLVNDGSFTYRPLRQWAHNRLTETPDGVVAVTPSAARELAAFIGCAHNELAHYLSQFLPEQTQQKQAA